jgi:hypothetical protein
LTRRSDPSNGEKLKATARYYIRGKNDEGKQRGAAVGGWGADLRKYKKERMTWPQHRPIPGGQPWKRDKKITNYEVSRNQRAFHPILQTFVESGREQALCQREKRQREAEMAKSADRVEKNTYVPYNIISTHLLPGKKDPPTRKAHRVPDSSIGFNIVNFQPKEKHLYIDRGPPKGVGMRSLQPMSGKKDYNVLSNEYYHDNNARQQQEREAQRKDLFEKFYRTRKYNHIKAAYYDAEKERDFVKMRDKLQKTNGLMQVEWLPETIKRAEGNLYNIINQSPKSGDAAQARLASWERKQATKFEAKITTKFEAKMKKRQKAEYDLKRTRQLNRLSETRALEQLRRGYDVITNENYFGVGSKNVYAPKKRPSPGVWTRTALARDGLRMHDTTMSGTRQGLANDSERSKAAAKNPRSSLSLRSNSNLDGGKSSVVTSYDRKQTRGSQQEMPQRPNVPRLAPGALNMVDGAITRRTVRTGGF